MKKIAGIVVVLGLLFVLGLGALAWYLYANKDEYLRRITERTLSFVLMVDVSVGSASLDIQGESVRFDDIVIGNPPGFNTSHAMKFGTVLVSADIRSFRTEVPVIRLIEVRRPDIIFEGTAATSNLQTLMNNAMRFASEEEAPEEAEKKYLIEKVIIAENTVTLSIPILGVSASTPTVRIPDIELENIGGEDEAVTPAEAFQQILAVILDRIRTLGGGIIPAELLASISGDLGKLSSDLRGGIQGAVGSITDTGGEAVTGAREAVEGAGEAARGALQEAEGAVRGIFGRTPRQETTD